MYVKIDGWPTVLANDSGIRPAGPPDRCFYCDNRVGELHGGECVCVNQRVRYRVLSDGVQVGTFEREDPYTWTEYDCEFHKNESSWCAGNAVDDVQWFGTLFAQKVRAFCEAIPDDSCACSTLEFRFDAVTDAGPLVEIRD